MNQVSNILISSQKTTTSFSDDELFLLLRKRESLGNPLLEVLRARRACITQHRGLSTALSLAMHIGATPSGPEPSGKNFHMASGSTNVFALVKCHGSKITMSDLQPPIAIAATHLGL